MRGARFLFPAFALVFALVLVTGLAGCDLLTGGEDDGAGGSDPGETEGVVRVTLSWNEAADVDLEIWDADGEETLVGPAHFGRTDIEKGADGDETFEFKSHDGKDFGRGQYVVSVYFADEETGVERANVTLTVDKRSGVTVTRTGTVYKELGRDQWHAFKIDATRGDIEEIDAYVEITRGK